MISTEWEHGQVLSISWEYLLYDSICSNNTHHSGSSFLYYVPIIFFDPTAIPVSSPTRTTTTGTTSPEKHEGKFNPPLPLLENIYRYLPRILPFSSMHQYFFIFPFFFPFFFFNGSSSPVLFHSLRSRHNFQVQNLITSNTAPTGYFHFILN